MSDLLNRDCWFNIVLFLEAKDVCSFSLTGKCSYSICNNETIWINLMLKDFIFPTSPSFDSYKQLYIHQHKQEKWSTTRSRIFKLSASEYKEMLEKDKGASIYDRANGERSIIKFLNEKSKTMKLNKGDVFFYESRRENRGDGFYYDGTSFKAFRFSDGDDGYAPSGKLTIYEFPVNYWIDRTDMVFFDTSPFIDQLVRNHKLVINEDGNLSYHKLTDEISSTSYSRFIESSFTYNNFEYFVYFAICEDYENKKINRMKLNVLYTRDCYYISDHFGMIPERYSKKNRSLFGFHI